MKLQLVIPPGWSRGGLRLFDPAPFPPDAEAWMAQVLGESLDLGLTVTVPHFTPTRSACGWAMQVAEVQVVDAQGQVREVRLAAFYRFLDFCAAALVHGIAPNELDRDRDTIVTLFKSATPHWQGEQIVALSELWADSAANPADAP